MTPGKVLSDDEVAAQGRLITEQREANQALVLTSIHAQELAELTQRLLHTVEEANRQLSESRRELGVREMQLRSLIDSMSQLAWTTRADGSIEFYNRRWFDYTGRVPPESGGAIGAPDWQAAVEPSERARVELEWKRAIETGEPFESSFPLRSGDGSSRWFLCRGSPIRDAAGEVVRWVHTCTDVDAQRQTAQELTASLDQERQLGDLRETFVGIVGHDLRGPLESISLGSQVLLEGATLNQNERVILYRMIRSHGRMKGMIAQMLDLTRARLGGGIPVDFKPADLARVCRQVAEESGFGVQVELEGDLIGEWDEDRLFELIGNLVRNALEHARPRTLVTLKGSGLERGEVVIEVINQGLAIPDDVLPFIFDPFRRGRKNQKTTSGGNLGLGLYIAHQLALLHHGSLTVSRVGESTVFSLRLPRKSGAIEPSPTEDTPG